MLISIFPLCNHPANSGTSEPREALLQCKYDYNSYNNYKSFSYSQWIGLNVLF